MANRLVPWSPETMKLPVVNALGLHVSLKNFAVTLHEWNRGLDLLLPAAEKFSGEWVIPYNLSCYCTLWKHCK